MLDLDDIKARAEAATPGPWFPDEGKAKVYNHAGEVAWCRDVVSRGHGAYAIGGQNSANARFTAHAREDVPALIAEVERLRGILGETERTIAGLVGGIGMDYDPELHPADTLRQFDAALGERLNL
jgi:hypothetical protein